MRINLVKSSVALIGALVLSSQLAVNVFAEEMKVTDKQLVVVGQKECSSLTVLGTRWTNERIPVYAGTNVLEAELGAIEKDVEIKFYNELVNGWVRIFHEGEFGFIDGKHLRETKEIVLPEKMPDTSKAAPKKKTVLKTYIGNDGIVKVINPEEEAVPDKEEVQRMMSADALPDKVETPTPTSEPIVEPKPEQGNRKTLTFRLSYYTNFLSENGGYTNTASGKPLSYGVIASNVYPLGTKIYLEGYGVMTVLDRGGKHFDSPDRLDVHIPPKDGESRAEYKKRVMAMGRQTTTGYIID